jgi:formylglycine-generating enzyme required for sulfatase activity
MKSKIRIPNRMISSLSARAEVIAKLWIFSFGALMTIHAEPSPLRFSEAVVTPASTSAPPSFTGTVTGGSPNKTAWLQASVDLGVADPWANIASAVFDSFGSATFTNIPDSRPQAAAASRDFFRVLAPPTMDGFVRITAGSFLMGDPSNPLVGSSDELPLHRVDVSEFYMGKYEVTKELWNEVRAWGMGHNYMDLSAGNGSYASKGVNHPVHSITWYDMVKWCNARSEMENLTPCYTVSDATYKTGVNDAVVCNWNANGYRLPSEAEWEKAARGGLDWKNFPWGDTIDHSHANYVAFGSLYSYDTSPYTSSTYHPSYEVYEYPYSSPVGSFAPNGYGLYDMAGNMWEWCWDRRGIYTSAPQTDPHGATSGMVRVFRGGSWGNSARQGRVAYRGGGDPGYSINDLGFRIARSSIL